MIIGLLKDIKNGEYRTVLTPVEVHTICSDGHKVLVQSGAGVGSGFDDDLYVAEGAEIVETAEEIWNRAELITKVKEIEPSEYQYLKEGQIILTCLHPAAHREEVDHLLESKVIAFTAEDSHRHGSPNCEAAGKQGVLFGLESMLTINGGKGKFVCGLAGAPAMEVLVLGAGVVGMGAIDLLVAMGAKVTVAATNMGKLRDLKLKYNNKIDTIMSTQGNIRNILPKIDMVINCVKWPKGKKGYLIDREMLLLMEKGSVLVDISNDTDAAIESFRETSHDNPRYVENGVVHYCVSNIPAAIAQSTSIAYAAAMLPHFRNILNNGVKEACIKDGYLRRSMTVYKGYLTHEETSAVQKRPWISPEDILDIEELDIDDAPPATVSRSHNYIDKSKIDL